MEKRNPDQEKRNQEKSEVWELEPITYIARLFSNEKTFIIDRKFKAIAVIQIAGETAQVMGFYGSANKKAFLNLGHKLKGLGVTKVIAERHGELKEWNI